MIRFDGYYITDGVLFDERKDPDNKWYLFIAYRFLENGIFLKATKFAKEKDSVQFNDSDFNQENSGLWELKNNQLVFHLNIGKPWESKELLEKSTCCEFIMKNERKIRFKSW